MPKHVLTAFLIASVGASLVADSWPHWRGPSMDGVSTREGSADEMERDRKRRVEAAAAGVQRLDADHLERPRLPERGHRARDRPDRAVGRRSQHAGASSGSGRSPAATASGNKQNMSSPSPVTDGRHVWVMTGTGDPQGVRLRRQGALDRAISRRTTAPFGIQFGYASSPLLHDDALYLQVLHGMNTDDPSYVLPIDKMTGKTVWRRRAADRCAPRIAGLVHDAGAPAARRQDRDRDHRRRRRHRSRSRHRQGSLARRRPQSEQQPQLPHHLVTDRRRRPDHRAEPRQPARGAATRRHRRHLEIARRLDVPSRPRRTLARQRRHLSLPGERDRASCIASTSRPARWSTGRAGCPTTSTARRPCWPTARST